VAGRITSLGIKAIWNFSPTQLTVPSDIIVRNENIALGLAILSYYLKRRKKEDSRTAGVESRENPPQKLIDIFARYQPKREFLVQILEETQKAIGYLSPEAIGHVADYLNVSREKVVEAAAFYPVFRTEPPVRYRIAICKGETCSRKGSSDLLEVVARELRISDGERTPDGMFSLETVPCRGMCAEAPTVSINDTVLTLRSPEDLLSHLQGLKISSQ